MNCPVRVGASALATLMVALGVGCSGAQEIPEAAAELRVQPSPTCVSPSWERPPTRVGAEPSEPLPDFERGAAILGPVDADKAHHSAPTTAPPERARRTNQRGAN